MEVDMEFYLEVLKNQIWMEGFLCGFMVMAFVAIVLLGILGHYNGK